MSISIRVFLSDHPSIIQTAEALEAAALTSLASDAETLVSGAIPVVGAMLKPLIATIVNKAIAEIEAVSAAEISKWIADQPGIVLVQPGSGNAGIISISEVPTEEVKSP